MHKTYAVLFDLDGVLALTESFKHAAHLEAIRCLGGMPPDKIYPQVIGRSLEACAEYYLQASGLPRQITAYSRYFRQAFSKMIQSPIPYRPNAKALLDELRRQGYRLGLVTSSISHEMERVLAGAQLGGYFQVTLCAEDVSNKKPHPEPYLKALVKLGVPANQALVFEDTPSGLEAARSADLPVIIMRHQENLGLDFPTAAAILNGWQDISAVIALVREILNQNTDN